MAMAERKVDDALVLTMTREFDASRERVFRAFSEPEQIVKWWGPISMKVVDHDLDVRVGGAWRTTICSEKGEDYTMSGVYQEITPPERLVFTWGWERDGARGHETIITVELAERGQRTELSSLQKTFESEDIRNSHGEGWSETFNGLEIELAEGHVG